MWWYTKNVLKITLMAKIIGGIIVVVVLIGVVFVWQGKKADAPLADTPGEVITGTEENLEDTGRSMVSSIKDAMGLGKAMQCTYQMNQGDSATAMTSTVSVEGEKFKSTTVMKDMTIYALFDGETQYTWMSNTKQGMKMSKDCLAKMTDSFKNMPQSTPAPSQPQDVREGFDMAQNVQCEESGKIDLTLPSDVTFTDQCAMMEQSLKMMEQLKQSMPAETMQISPY